MKKVLAAVFTLVLVFTMAACGTNNETKSNSNAGENTAGATQSPQSGEEAAAGKDDKITIGVSLPDYSNIYWLQIKQGIEEQAKVQGIELLVNDAKGDINSQINAIENWITQKVDGLIIGAVEPTAVDVVIKKAADAGIKVLAQSTDLPSAHIWASADEYDMGKNAGIVAGEWMKENLTGKVKVAILNYPILPQLIDRVRGIEEKVKELYPEAEIVAKQSAATQAEGITATETILQAHPDVSVIVAINDAGALGAYQAMKAAGKVGDKTAVVGIGTADDFMAGLKEEGSNIRGTVDIVPVENGKTDIELLSKLINGEQVERKYVVPAKPLKTSDVK